MEVVIGGTLAGLPVVNVPVDFDEDQRVLEPALAYERVTDHLDRRPELIEAQIVPGALGSVPTVSIQRRPRSLNIPGVSGLFCRR